MDHAGVPQRRVPSLMDVTGVDEGPSDVRKMLQFRKK